MNKHIIPSSATLLDALAQLNRLSGGEMTLFVTDSDSRVVGSLTDGDIRRAMESSRDRFFDLTVKDIMTKTPKTVPADTKITDIEDLLREYKIHSVLVTDEDGKLLGVVDSFSTMI